MLVFKPLLKNFSAVLIFIQICGTAFANNNIQVELSDGTILKDVTSTSKNLSDEELKVLGLIVGKSTLSDVLKVMPKNQIVHQGDAASGKSTLCYFDGQNRTLTFVSGEMGGSQKVITLVNLEEKLKPLRCVLAKKIFSNLRVSELHLGMGKREVLNIKGKPNKELENLIFYNYESFVGEGLNKMNITSSIELYFRNNKLVKISLSKIESQ